MIDIVYIMGTGSKWNDNELCYSLRSLEKYVTGFGNVVIAGHKPEFLNDKVYHIPLYDVHPTNAAKNIAMKLREVCTENVLTEDIMVLNDDYFFTEPVDAPKYPHYYKCDLYHTQRVNTGNNYVNYVNVTIEALKQRNLPLKNFDTHKPIIYNRKELRNIIESLDWSGPHSYIMRSLYCNFLQIEGNFMLDNKINHKATKQGYKKIAAQAKHCFSIGENACCKELLRFFEEFYPNKSKYEK